MALLFLFFVAAVGSAFYSTVVVAVADFGADVSPHYILTSAAVNALSADFCAGATALLFSSAVGMDTNHNILL